MNYWMKKRRKLEKIIIDIEQILRWKACQIPSRVRLILDYPMNKIGRHINPGKGRIITDKLVVWEPPWNRLYAHVSLAGVVCEEYRRAEPLET